MHKIHWYGINGEVHRWIQDFFNNRTHRVVVEGVSSDASPVVSGVPQVTPETPGLQTPDLLGPCLFLFYTNDIAVGLQSTVRLFADDIMLSHYQE